VFLVTSCKDVEGLFTPFAVFDTTCFVVWLFRLGVYSRHSHSPAVCALKASGGHLTSVRISFSR